MTKIYSVVSFVSWILLLSRGAFGFVSPTINPSGLGYSKCLYAQDGNPPPFPSSFPSNNNNNNNNNIIIAEEHSNDTADDVSMNRANRFSKYAPSAELSTDEFRAQLKENMKADLEKRRQQHPTRGNQPAKNYLDSL